MKKKWKIRKFESCINKVTYTNKVRKNDFLKEGKYPIVSQEDGLINGFWNNDQDVFKIKKPIVIFGDHTRVLKYVDFDFVLGADGVKILEPTNNIDSKFLLYYLTWYNVPNLGYSRHYKLLKEISLPIPPLHIQEAIVKELDVLHRLKELQEQQLAEYDNLAQSTFYSMFGDPINNEKGWEVKKLGDVVKPKTEIKRAKREIQANETISYIDISSIDNSTNKITSFTEYVFSEAPSRAQQIVKVGDIVISLVRPNLNNVAIVDDCFFNSVASSGFCVLRPHLIDLQFLFHIVKGNNFREHLSARTSGANYPAVREEDIKSFDLIYPPLPLQTSFAERIEKIEEQKELVKQGITETQLLIDYTMDKYFGGNPTKLLDF